MARTLGDRRHGIEHLGEEKPPGSGTPQAVLPLTVNPHVSGVKNTELLCP